MFSSLYPLARASLFKMDAEDAHHLTLRALGAAGRTGLACALSARVPDAPRTVMGLTFRNPVGLAAGLDKDGAAIDGLASLGFGFIEVGTVTPRPQPGNPRPRMFRLPQAEALINRMGFNNHGVDQFVKNVQAARYRGILGLNIGKNADTPIERAAEDYLYCLERVYPFASYVTINISSPNTKNLRQLQGAGELDALLAALKDKQQRLADLHGKLVPLALKIAPDLDDEQVKEIGDTLLRHKIEAVIATNTTLSRAAVQGLPHADEAGGLSGRPVFDASNEVIRKLHAQVGSEVPIIGVGGIFSGDDARAKLAAGASLVQLYTGFIYRGPALVAECVKAIARERAA
ncbi:MULTISPECIES: quinone-dependent dihydroorotate dehydrogenase [Burkholderia]|uniref:Dihydroorotate dehydrogenase (quinone) n=1 Tax=Burkholderia anthina TaxID=179879 RepID=A0A7T7AIN2_9BURK|nr:MULTISPECIES: quinone-dependent dihydroorotate dehydrogenase [Burkholderia]MBY4865648.1 quinone-dependent dihydroorotate dehydrogenase [Burkholderia anthina]PFH12982.1 dihydroorotate oxidase A [Burkholderia sp. JKS000303]QQK04066.1 quinone-dependent dihydroorotate dehydrogenase [Burkholderia anthina]RQZ29612.1 quinone-dependent dihydroorotate dehydrogenase [Burkholderia sp. Bp9017]RQZ37143.1 quinone-dependent dihydroorotate dehydrogenase [Burkholderia sp. Bp9016]